MDERKPGDMGRYGDAGDLYYCRDCGDKVWSPAHHDDVHARRAATVSGVQRIAAERERQTTEEGHSVETDARWTEGELGQAAYCYLIDYLCEHFGVYPPERRGRNVEGLINWPWANEYKPTRGDSVRQLAKVGALIAAEIDRLNAELTEQLNAAVIG